MSTRKEKSVTVRASQGTDLAVGEIAYYGGEAATGGGKRTCCKRATESFAEDTTQKTDDDLSSQAKKAMSSLGFSDLRRGTIELRNAQRNLILQAILSNIAAPKGQKKSIMRLAKEYGIHRETMSKYYRSVESNLKIGIEVLPNLYAEKRRGRKPNDKRTSSDERSE